MRPKIVFVVLLMACGLLGIVALVFKSSKNQPAPVGQAEEVSQPKSASIDPHAAAPQGANSNGTEIIGAEAATGSVTQEFASALSTGTNLSPAAQALAHAKYVRKRKAEFHQLSMNSDQGSLNKLLLELKNPDKEIRKAALEGVVQFDDRSAIPSLKDLANQTDDPREKIEILEAIEFMNLPSLDEFVAQRKAGRAALGITEKSVSKKKLKMEAQKAQQQLPPPQPVPQPQPNP